MVLCVSCLKGCSVFCVCLVERRGKFRLRVCLVPRPAVWLCISPPPPPTLPLLVLKVSVRDLQTGKSCPSFESLFFSFVYLGFPVLHTVSLSLSSSLLQLCHLSVSFAHFMYKLYSSDTNATQCVVEFRCL